MPKTRKKRDKIPLYFQPEAEGGTSRKKKREGSSKGGVYDAREGERPARLGQPNRGFKKQKIGCPQNASENRSKKWNEGVIAEEEYCRPAYKGERPSKKACQRGGSRWPRWIHGDQLVGGTEHPPNRLCREKRRSMRESGERKKTAWPVLAFGDPSRSPPRPSGTTKGG